MSLALVPSAFDEANAFVRAHHRHHGPVRGAKFCLGVIEIETHTIVGVAIVGRPVARHLDDQYTLEVLRVATVGHKNACSLLYGASWRATKALGYRRLVTYTLPEEGGASLRAAGWKIVAESKGGSWSRKDRPRVDTHPTQRKLRWAPAELA